MLSDVEKRNNLMLTRLTPGATLVYVTKSEFHLINVFCVVTVVRKWLAQVVFSYFVLHRCKIPLVLTTKVLPHCYEEKKTEFIFKNPRK